MTELLFVDDLILRSYRKRTGERNVKVLDEVMTKWRVTIKGKDKGDGSEERKRHINHHNKWEEIENMRKIKYLGAMLDKEESCEAE